MRALARVLSDAEGKRYGPEVMSENTESETNALAAMRALIGRPIGAPSVAPDPVNQPMIRHWAAAFEDANPVYTDPEAAARVALRRDRRAAADAADLDDGDAADHRASPSAAARRSRAGAPTVLTRARRGRLRRHAGVELRVRDRALPPRSATSCRRRRCSSRCRREKQTRIGAGHFVTWVTTYTDAAGEVVGRQTLPHPEVPPDGGAAA